MSDLLETVENGVATLTLNRPDRLNAFSVDMLERLESALKRFADDDAVGAIILTGAGNGFCAGGDVKAMAERSASGEAAVGANNQLRDRMENSLLLHRSPKPTIAMINGPAAGAGLALALACDMRVMAESARLTTAFARVGFSGDFGGTYFLSRLIGTAKAKELYFFSPQISAQEAAQLGIVSKVVPDADLRVTTVALAQQFANGPRQAFRRMKENFLALEAISIDKFFDLEAANMLKTAQTEDHREAARAFVEKRAPVFKGR